MTRTELLNKLNERTDKSAWGKAVTLYAYELVESLEVEELPEDFEEFKTLMLNGADDWSQYSWGGSSLIYDCDIAERTCTPSELKKTKGGELTSPLMKLICYYSIPKATQLLNIYTSTIHLSNAFYPCLG